MFGEVKSPGRFRPRLTQRGPKPTRTSGSSSLCIPSLAQCPSESFPLRTKSVRATIQPGVSQSVGHLSQRIMCLLPYTLKSLSQETTCICNLVVKASSHGCFLQRFLRGFRAIFPRGSGGFRGVPRAETWILEACRPEQNLCQT